LGSELFGRGFDSRRLHEFAFPKGGMKIINVRVIPNAQHEAVRVVADKIKVYVTAPAVAGKANQALQALLADFFGVRKRAVTIIRGERSREKIVRIDTTD